MGFVEDFGPKANEYNLAGERKNLFCIRVGWLVVLGLTAL